MANKKTYNEKLHDSLDMPHISELTDPKQIAKNGGPRLLIAPPMEYDEIMRRVPKGKVITSEHIRGYLAKKHGADNTCPLTAGLFINIAARASLERGTDETPFWRTLKKGGELNAKYPGGIAGQKLLLEAEGHSFIQRGERCFVKDYEKKMYELE